MTQRRTFDFSTGNLVLDNQGNIKVVNDLEALRQFVLQKLNFVRGSWIVNTTVGVPYKEEVLTKISDPGLVTALFNSVILSEDDVIGIGDLSTSMNPATRTLTYRATVNTVYGAMEISI